MTHTTTPESRSAPVAPVHPAEAEGDEVSVFTGEAVRELLEGRESEILEAVREAYELHATGRTVLPDSNFLRFPGRERERIIALPAYVGGEHEAAGIKWIASWPQNVQRGMDRASAVMILNSTETGRPTAILEGSIISAKRTAASAALAAATLHAGPEPQALGLVGCGLINFEVARFAVSVFPSLERFVFLDLDPEHAARFGERLQRLRPGARVEAAGAPDEVFAGAPLVSLATTAVAPHLDSLAAAAEGSTVLHVSLRDFTPEVVLACDNVVDDVEHVCRAQTSVHLAAQRTGGTGFIRGTLGDVLLGRIPPRSGGHPVTLFSPFGMGILDLAVAGLVRRRAAEGGGAGVRIPGFIPRPWTERL